MRRKTKSDLTNRTSYAKVVSLALHFDASFIGDVRIIIWNELPKLVVAVSPR